jgi:hypothetical protein
MGRIYIGFLALVLALFSIETTKAQGEVQREVVQFSGIVVMGDSLVPVPFAGIWSSSRKFQGTLSDYFGFFSLAVFAGDTVNFSSVGFRPTTYIVPEDLEVNRISVVQFMRRDTVQLPTTFIYPWPTKERFKKEFLALDLPDDNIQRAKKNLDPEKMYTAMVEMGMGANENFKYAMEMQHDQLRYANQAPPIQILNPIAWAKFVQAWRNGDFKKKE